VTARGRATFARLPSLQEAAAPRIGRVTQEDIMKLLSKLLVACGVALVAGMASLALAEEFKAPEGKVAIHYFRPDGSYDGWGLHVWESFQKKDEAGDEFAAKEMSDRPLKGVTWGNPMKPTGQDESGIYWVMDAKEFDNGRVNYIIHKGDSKEQGKADKFFLIKDGRDAYVNAGDKRVYQSKDEAVKARK
jgi:hypothetical protein